MKFDPEDETCTLDINVILKREIDRESFETEKEKNFLVIEGHPLTHAHEGDISYKVLHKGISNRSFKREFKLADHVDIVNANLELGILAIYLKREVPEEERPKAIAINYTK